MWWDESDDVVFEVERRISRSTAATRRAEKAESGKDKTPPDGRYYVPVPKTRGGAPFPTFHDWIKELERKKGQK